MLIFETIGCPTCSGKIAVIVEDNVITSHGVCPGCDNTFSAERLMFIEQCKAFEDEFMHEEHYDDVLLNTVDIELADFYYRLAEKGVVI